MRYLKVMSADSKPALRRIRTFAQDLEEAKEQHGEPTTAATVSDTPTNAVSVPTEKAASAKVFETITPSEHIPAFHELQKKAGAQTATAHSTPATKAAPVPKITVRKKHDLAEPRHAGGGTIITDTKRTELNFFESAIQDLTNWFKALGKTQKKHPPTYTITDTERRKGIIQKATSKSGSIFTADSETLKEEIRRRIQQSPVAVSPTASESTHVTWSPQTEAGYPLLSSHTAAKQEPERIKVQFKKQTLPAPVLVEPTLIASERDADEARWEFNPPPRIERASTVPPPQKVVPPPVVPVPPTPAPEPTVRPVVPPPVIEEPVPVAVAEPPVPAEPASEAVSMRDRLQGLLHSLRFNTNTLTIGIASVLVFAALVAFTARGIFVLVTRSVATDTTIAATAEPLLSHSTLTKLEIKPLQSQAVPVAIAGVGKPDGVVYELELVDSKGVPLSLSDTLLLIGFQNNKNLNQTITALHLITQNNQRAIVFTVSDRISAFGALLAWESTMSSSLSALLGSAATDAPAPFTDVTVGTSDVRLLTVGGEEALAYGFINQNTLLITKNVAAFAAILGTE